MPYKIEDTASRQVRLGDYPFFSRIFKMMYPKNYQNTAPDTVMTVVAVRGSRNDWIAYFQTPQCPSGTSQVIELGGILPFELALLMFPEWAGRWEYHPARVDDEVRPRK